MARSPKLSVVISTRNRAEDVIDAIRSIQSQEGPPPEIVLVDDASTEETLRKLRDELGQRQVSIVPTRVQIGACAARNLGAQIATGDWLVFLDDDLVFADGTGVATIRRVIREEPGLAAMGFRLVHYRTGELCNWMYNIPPEAQHQRRVVTKFPAGGGAIRRHVFLALGGFPERFEYYGEEGVLGLRLVDEGYRILYVPEVTLRHKVTPVARVPGRRLYYDVRNNIWLALLMLPTARLLRHVVSVGVRQLILSVHTGTLRYYLRGMRDGILGASEMLAKRRPVRPSTARGEM